MAGVIGLFVAGFMYIEDLRITGTITFIAAMVVLVYAYWRWPPDHRRK
jgi:hypothetical protein